MESALPPTPHLLMALLLQVGQLIMFYTAKKVLPFAFFLTYIKDLDILDSQNNNLWTNSLIGVQGDCPYIF